VINPGSDLVKEDFQIQVLDGTTVMQTIRQIMILAGIILLSVLIDRIGHLD
jgi:hypothetical protein